MNTSPDLQELRAQHEGIVIESRLAAEKQNSYLGDAVLDISLTPNIARAASVLGVAREVAAITGRPLRHPDYTVKMEGAPIAGKAAIEIRVPELNPRFVLGLVQKTLLHYRRICHLSEHPKPARKSRHGAF